MPVDKNASLFFPCLCVCVTANRAQSSAASSSQTGDALGKALASVSAAHTNTTISIEHTYVTDLFSISFIRSKTNSEFIFVHSAS